MSMPIRAAALAALSPVLWPLLWASPAQAAPRLAPPTTVDTVVVTAQTAGSPTQPNIAQQKAALDSVAGSVGFVPAEQFQNRYANTLRDVLKDTPGVFVQTRYGQELRLSIRGSGVGRGFHLRGIEVLQDGVPWNLADGSGDFYEIDPLSLRSVEIYKGGDGLQFGSSALGGAVNFVTPTARTAVSPNLLRFEGGSFGTYRASATLSRVMGDFDGLVTVTGNHVDGARQHSRSNALFLNGNLGWRINDRVETRLYLSVDDTRQQLPGTLSLADALAYPDRANQASARNVASGNQQRNDSVQRIADRTSVRLDSGQVDVDVWAYHKHLYHPIFQVVYQDGWTWGGDAKYTGRFDLDGHANELIVGARATAGNNHAKQFLNLAGARLNDVTTANAHQRALNVEGYVEDRFYLVPTFAVMAGAKYAANDRDLLNVTAPGRSADKTYWGLSPKVGVLWRPTPAVQVFADVTRSRDTPDFTDLAQASPFVTQFAPLRQQRAWTYEAGTRGTLGPATFDVTLYRAEIEGELLQFTVDPSIPAATFNADRTIHQGVEASVRVKLTGDLTGVGDGVSVQGLWNHNDFRFDHDRIYGDNQIAGTPRDVLRFETRYTRPRLGSLSEVYVAPQVDWVLEGAFADQANTLQAPGYVVLGVEAGFALPHGLALFVEGRNLTDQAYVSDISVITDARRVAASIFYPGDRRSVYAGVRYAF